jgi:malate synthase
MTVEIRAPHTAGAGEILSDEALDFLATLHRTFESRRREILADRHDRQLRLDAGEQPSFLGSTAAIRADEHWRVPPAPEDLRDRRVEITGPVDRKMVINALNSGANVFMADFEDSNTPTWDNCVQGQRNLRDAVRRTIDFTGPDGREYRLGTQTATLVVRPRGWHLVEKHLLVDGMPVSASLFDVGLYLFHNASALVTRGSGPYFYLPKLESHLEARLWNDVFVAAEDRLGFPRGTIRATVLIETILAAFEMEEILYELREHSSGLNCGRWDYLFSIIKKFRADRSFVLADRARLTMTTHFMRSYSLLAIQTCHRRGAHAIGGMAAQIPIKRDAVANEEALGRVRADKEREAADGHDGTWVAHPALVPIARAAFDAVMPDVNQIDRIRDDVRITAADLLDFSPSGPVTEGGLRTNLSVSLQYLSSWLAGTGCVPINDLMEDAATAEICRSQLWQWIRCPTARLEDGRTIDAPLVSSMLREEVDRIARISPFSNHIEDAAKLVEDLATATTFAEFLTLPAYELID